MPRTSQPPGGIAEYTTTTGTGAYVLRGALPEYAPVISRYTHGAEFKYRAADGVRQEVGYGRFDAVNNALERIPTRIEQPGRGVLIDWGPGRKLIYVESSQEFEIPEPTPAGAGFEFPPGFDGQVWNSLGGTAAEWGQRVIGMAALESGDDGTDVTIIGGAGNGTGDGGAVDITGGTTGDNGNDGGEVNIAGGNAFPGSAARGGNVNITAGNADPTWGNNGGQVTISTPDALSEGEIVNPIVLQGGDAHPDGSGSNGQGGAVQVRTGAGSSVSNGGQFEVLTGGTVDTDGQSGDIAIQTGADADVSGFIKINSGTPGSGSGPRTSAGDVIISSSASTYSTNYTGKLVLEAGSELHLKSGSTTSVSNGDIVFVTAQADRSYQFVTSGASVTTNRNAGVVILDGVSSTFTINLPASPTQGRIVRYASDDAIGSLTVAAPGGATVRNAPASLSAGQGIAYMYRSENTTWYRLH